MRDDQIKINVYRFQETNKKLFSGKIDVGGHKEESEVDLRFSGHKIKTRQITDALKRKSRVVSDAWAKADVRCRNMKKGTKMKEN